MLGASAFTMLEDWITRFDYWRFIFGLVILAIVIAAPDGLAGGLSRFGALLSSFRSKEAPR